MAAVLGDEARLAGAVAEEDEVLAEDLDPQRIAGAGESTAPAAQVGRRLDGQPVATKHLA